MALSNNRSWNGNYAPEGFLALLHFHFPEPSSCEVLKFDENNLILRGDRIKMKCEPERESSKSTQCSIFTL